MAMFGKVRGLVNVLPAFPGVTATLLPEGQEGRGGDVRRLEREGD